MKLFLLKIVMVLSFFAFISCEEVSKPEPVAKPQVSQKPYKAGVVLSFDDAYVDEWFDANQILKKYGWKASFCVCRIDSIGTPQIQKLLEMQKEGHEIAGHGYHHYNAIKYVAANGINEYMKQEIDPMLASMNRLSFNVSSFAYPYGQRSDSIDKALSSKFNIIRGRAFRCDTPETEGCYFRGGKYMYAFGIDDNHVHFSMSYLLELLDYTKKNNKILILCGHKPVKNVTENYQTKIETLEFICDYMKLNDLQFYTLSDLYTMMSAN
ncbi:peptidoglycan/xylan/chitin deacetylase (PgdA/CDA1 family) [Flavobacterium sp. 28YEA47A]|uniref:polysaccharide deacetylase family protein n=1 Tax=Flavobacterium sp. 28YEA47A TaxID=3156276 RepID=UPI0035157E0E